MRSPLLRIFAAAAVFFAASCADRPVQDAPLPYADIAEKLRVLGLREEGAFALLERLTSTIGPRLTASPQAAAAVDFIRAEMDRLGLETWLEPVTVQHWVRGSPESAKIAVGPGRADVPLTITALGWSVATPEEGIQAPIVEMTSFEDLKARAADVRGRIVFFNKPMDRSSLDNFRSYGEAAQFRARGASEAARFGAVGVLVRSATQRLDDFPHTGMVQYAPDVPRIPASALSTSSAEILSSALKARPGLEVWFRQSCRNLPDAPSANVVGEIRGTDRPDEIVLLGGHLDSWDLGTGAHDDGAGCVQAVEALRLIRSLGLRPKRSIRAVMFMNEEFGATGGREYARADRRSRERHLAAMESDRGGFLPLGFAIGGSPDKLLFLQRWEYLLKPAGIYWIGPGGGGSDIGPIVEQGAVAMAFIPDSRRYFDVHHSAHDVLASVHPRELELGAVVMAIMAYVVAQEGF